MAKRGIIIDLDNTIYSVHSVGDQMFSSLFELIEKEGLLADRMDEIKDQLMRRPFQHVAKDFQFNKALIDEGTDLLKNLDFQGQISTYPGYELLRELEIDKFLVTAGFEKLQRSKLAAMGIENDFADIYIVDPESGETKKDAFVKIMRKHNYTNHDLVVLGDDLHSEIAAAQSLGIEAILFDADNRYPNISDVRRIQTFAELIGEL